MNRDAYGFSLSFFMHATILMAIIYLCPTLNLQPKPLVIDFSLVPSGSHNISAAPPVKEPAKQPPILKVPPMPKQLALPKSIERVLAKEPPKPVFPKKILTRPMEKILPKEEDKVEQQEIIPETAEINTPTPPITSNLQDASAEQQEVSETAIQENSSVGGSASAVSSKAMEQRYVSAHFIYIKKIIEKNISYPSMARRMGWQGKVVVSFVVCQNGTVENLQVVESSGHAQLDKNALETVRQVVPFPSPPVRVRLVLPVTYKIS